MKRLIVVALCVAWATVSPASLYVYEGFNYTAPSELLQSGDSDIVTNSVDGAISLPNVSSVERADGWMLGVMADVAGFSLSYTDAFSRPLESSGGHARLRNARGIRYFTTAYAATGGVVYVSYLYDPGEMNDNGERRGHFELRNASGGVDLRAGSGLEDESAVHTSENFWLRYGNSEADTGVLLQGGTTYFIVVRVTYNATGQMDAFSLWLNPADLTSEGDSGPPLFEASGLAIGLGGFGGFVFRKDNIPGDNPRFDEIRVGSSWDAVTPAGDVISVEGISYDALGAQYTQDFSALRGPTNEDLPWTDHVTLEGWRLWSSEQGAAPTNYFTRFTGGIGEGEAVLGRNGVEDDLDVWGARTAIAYGDAYTGLVFTNNTGDVVESFDLAFDAYQYYKTVVAQEMHVYYSTDATSLASGTWTPLPSLTYTSVYTTGNATVTAQEALDSKQSFVLEDQDVFWGPGAPLWIRWVSYRDLDESYTAGAAVLAISDVVFSTDSDTPPPVTPPSLGNAQWTLAGDGLVLTWDSEAEAMYHIYWTDDLLNDMGDFIPIATDLPATPPVNVYTDQVYHAESIGFYQIRAE